MLKLLLVKRAEQKRLNRKNETPERRENRLAKARQYQKDNKEKIRAKQLLWREENKEHLKEYFKKRSVRISESNKIRMREWRRANMDHKREQNRLWAEANPEKVLEVARVSKRKRRQSPAIRLSESISTQVRQSLRCAKDGASWEDILGYTRDDLVKHLERQFTVGMSWDNYGEWHVDHVVPQDSFSFLSIDDEQFKACWAITNLQPLWALDNIRKGNRL